ncbi:hypothetical protein ACN38_g2837 [Penicillium nordicum]|uniref:Uncharacterized protein n=1 Tax=Penicillium nordicum TaxID=229535 RepID=A0A0M8PET6_9EURO|nr:hypothetical protein ACN38_g2837 [Penicillium nordicum]
MDVTYDNFIHASFLKFGLCFHVHNNRFGLSPRLHRHMPPGCHRKISSPRSSIGLATIDNIPLCIKHPLPVNNARL